MNPLFWFALGWAIAGNVVQWGYVADEVLGRAGATSEAHEQSSRRAFGITLAGSLLILISAVLYGHDYLGRI